MGEFEASRYTLLASDPHSRARRGVLETPHGKIQTPIFMPVGTLGTVKGMMPRTLEEIGAQIILGNTYHLNLRPGSDLVRDCGGLHTFMDWPKPILTDSGGFQVFSLSSMRKLSEEGVEFRSHIDGRKVFLGPKEVLQIQSNLGSDIAMVLDECPAPNGSHSEIETSVDRSMRWAKRCKDEALHQDFIKTGQQLFGIVQGGRFGDLRKKSAEVLCGIDFPGYAIGGVSVGEPEELMLEQVDVSAAVLPEHKPRYVMGVGTPPQLLEMIALGADMFDCVMPSREARHGCAFSPWGKINLKNSRYKEDQRPLVEGMQNYTCQRFSRAYLRHLFVAGETLGGVLLTLHNLHFFLSLMESARSHIEAGDFVKWKNEWIKTYREGEIP